MAFAHGRFTTLKLGTVDLSAWTDNTDFTDEADIHETTTYGKTAKTKVGGLLNSVFKVGGTYDTATGGPEVTIRPLIGTTTTIELGPEGNASGKKKVTGAVVVKSFNTTLPVAGMIKWTADLEGSDALTVGTFP